MESEDAARAELRRAVLQLRVAGSRRRRTQPPQTGA
jgi:hypothetical protein